MVTERIRCDNCRGTGRIVEEMGGRECWQCRGTGFEDPYRWDTPIVNWPRVYGKHGEVVVTGGKMMAGGSSDEDVQVAHRRGKVREMAIAVHRTMPFLPPWVELSPAHKSIYLTAAEAALKAGETYDELIGSRANRSPASGEDAGDRPDDRQGHERG